MDIIQACVTRPNLRDATLAPKIGDVSAVLDDINLEPLSDGKPQTHRYFVMLEIVPKRTLKGIWAKLYGVYCGY